MGRSVPLLCEQCRCSHVLILKALLAEQWHTRARYNPIGAATVNRAATVRERFRGEIVKHADATNVHQAPATPEQVRQRLDFTDPQLLAECETHLYKASGPGGQHRNKVTSAVRLVHRPSGLHATGTESRSQHENRARALRRLREAIALSARVPLPKEIVWPENVQVPNGRLRVNEKNPAIHHVIALVLDAFAEHGGEPRPAAAALGLTSSGLVKFLYEHRKAWSEVAHMREKAGLRPLHAPK